MAKYLVGEGQNMWRFENAFQNASSGDIIEFQKGYCSNIGELVIDKDIELVGFVEQNANGGYHFFSTLIGQIFIKNNAKVRIQNMWLRCNAEKINILNCRGGSKLQLNHVVIENSYEQGEIYPIIWGENESEFQMDWVEVIANKSNHLRMLVNNCKVELVNSGYFHCTLAAEKSEVKICNSSLYSERGNVLNVKKSIASLENVTLNGADSTLGIPALWSANSYIYAKNCTINQSQYEAAVYLQDNSCIEIDNSKVTSIKVLSGRASVQNTTVCESIQLSDKSYVYIEGAVSILGENEDKVHVYVGEKSVLKGEKLCFHKILNPNIRVWKSSCFELDEAEYVQGNISELITDIDETSRMSILTQENVKAVPDKTKLIDNVSSREKLNQMIGLKSVKKEIEKMLRTVDFNRQRIERGLEPLEQSLHAVFLGNPGTGKTTVARLIGEVLFESGAFKSDEFKLVEASEPDFISQYVGETAKQTLEILEKAKGGVLFIDEAYALNKKGATNDHGIEAINTILKYMEDHRDEIMIIFAGYTKEMEQFLKTNPGLKSRIPNTFVFEDYTPEEIVEIGTKELEGKQYIIEDAEYYEQNVKRAYKNSLDHSNARWIRNFNEKLIKTLADRVIDEGGDDFVTICKRDIENVMAQNKYKNLGEINEDAMDRLKKLIGINMVKAQVEEFVSMAEFNQKREEQGLENGDFTLHSLFLGNPGTGKTTVARIIGEILYQKGIIAEKKFIEVGPSDLVAGYIGQTSLKTREVLESALGGVLFIDEAYGITQGENKFGIEAVNEILKFMEDHRRDMVIIMAGYTNEMGEFMKANSGFTSRVPHTFNFEDYTKDEIVQIGLLGLENNGYHVDETLYGEVVKNCYSNSDDHSNGRWIRNLNEKLFMIMSKRIVSSGEEDLSSISEEDIRDLAEAYGVVMDISQNDNNTTDKKVDENGYVLPN